MQDLREQQIYQAAIRVFAEKGFEKTTMEGIANQASVALIKSAAGATNLTQGIVFVYIDRWAQAAQVENTHDA